VAALVRRPGGHDAGLALGRRAEHREQLLLQQREADRPTGLDGPVVLDQVAKALSPSSPSGMCSEIGSRAYLCTS
jgi:hypothetical protein